MTGSGSAYRTGATGTCSPTATTASTAAADTRWRRSSRPTPKAPTDGRSRSSSASRRSASCSCAALERLERRAKCRREPAPARRNAPAHRDALASLSAAAGSPVARDGGPRGQRGAVPRLERTHHRRVLPPTDGCPPARRTWADRGGAEPLRADQLQRRSDTPRVARGACTRRRRCDPRRGRGDGAPRRTRARDRPAVRARDPPARDAARPRDARPVGGHRLPPSIRPRPRGHVAPGDGRRRRHARVSRRGRDRLHHRRPAPDRADPCAGRRRVAAGRRRGRPVRPLRGPAPVGSVDHRLPRSTASCRGRPRSTTSSSATGRASRTGSGARCPTTRTDDS